MRPRYRLKASYYSAIMNCMIYILQRRRFLIWFRVGDGQGMTLEEGKKALFALNNSQHVYQ